MSVGELPPGPQTWAGLHQYCFDPMIRSCLDKDSEIANHVLHNSNIISDFETISTLFDLAQAHTGPRANNPWADQLGFTNVNDSSKYQLAITIEVVGRKVVMKNICPRWPDKDILRRNPDLQNQQGGLPGEVFYMEFAGLRISNEISPYEFERHRKGDIELMARQTWLGGVTPFPEDIPTAAARLSDHLGLQYSPSPPPPPPPPEPDERLLMLVWERLMKQWESNRKLELYRFGKLLHAIHRTARGVTSAERLRLLQGRSLEIDPEPDYVSLGLDPMIRDERIGDEAEIWPRCNKFRLLWHRSPPRPKEGDDDDCSERRGIFLCWDDEQTKSLPDTLTPNTRSVLGHLTPGNRWQSSQPFYLK